MMSSETAVARPLKILVPMIKTEIKNGEEAAEKASLEYYQRAGELLIEAKSQINHGDWDGWVKRNFKVSRMTAWRWMNIGDRNARVTFKSVSAAGGDHRSAAHRPAWHVPVRDAVERVDVERLAQDRQDRAREEKLIRQLALQLIDVGYKALAAKLHPDRGGSDEAMARLNHVRKVLQQAV